MSRVPRGINRFYCLNATCSYQFHNDTILISFVHSYAFRPRKNAQDNDDNKAADEEEEEEAIESKENFWDTPEAEMLKNDEDAQKSLKVYKQGSQRREQGQMALNKAAVQSAFGMEVILKETFPDTIVDEFKAEWKNMFEKLNSELEVAFQKNTEKRWEMQDRLDKYGEQWQLQYRALACCIQDVPNPDEAKEESKMDNSLEQDAKDSMPGDVLGQEVTENATAAEDLSPSKDSDTSGDELDFTLLLDQDHAPTVNRINHFLKTRARLQAAEDEFDASYNHIRAMLDVVTESILNNAIDVHFQLDGALEEDEAELQQYLVSNYRRRAALKLAVKKQQEESLTFLARLYNSIAGDKRKRP